jgi:pyruvate/2-oxoglutarate dehydrogenase complex dihydrolipoamide dehydrogenase (E3) component
MQSVGQATPRAKDGSAEPHGVEMEQRLQTSNSNLYAVGDRCARYKRRHASMAMGQLAVRNALDPVAGSLRLAAGADATPDLNGGDAFP